MDNDTAAYPYAVAEYNSFQPPLVEAVPSIWLYGGKIKSTADGQQIIHALSYWPKQISKVDVWIRNNRNPGGAYELVDSTLWETDLPVIILDFCGSLEEAKKKRDKSLLTDHLDTTDLDESQMCRRLRRNKANRQRLISDSDDEEAPPLKQLKIQTNEKGKKDPKRGSSAPIESITVLPECSAVGKSMNANSHQGHSSKHPLKGRLRKGRNFIDDDDDDDVLPTNLSEGSELVEKSATISSHQGEGSKLPSTDRTRQSQNVVSTGSSTNIGGKGQHKTQIQQGESSLNSKKKLNAPVNFSDRGSAGVKEITFISPSNSHSGTTPPYVECAVNISMDDDAFLPDFSPDCASSQHGFSSECDKENADQPAHEVILRPDNFGRKEITTTPAETVIASSSSLVNRVREGQFVKKPTPVSRTLFQSPSKQFKRTVASPRRSPWKSPNTRALQGLISSSLKAMSKQLSDTQSSVNNLSITVNKIWAHLAPPLERPPAATNDFPPMPLKDIEAFEKWESFIKDSEQFFIAVNLISGYGVPDFRQAVYSMLKQILSDELAVKFNVEGRNKKDTTEKKLGLSETQTFKLLKVALKKYINSHNSGGNDPSKVNLAYNAGTFKDNVGRWLKDSRSRLKNKMKKQSSGASQEASSDESN